MSDKPNGKTIPPIADLAEALQSVNEKMNGGMIAPPRVLAWNPVEDITTYELARALMVLIVGVGGGNAFDVLDRQAPDVTRHFQEPAADDEA
jgi:hypothetical protein